MPRIAPLDPETTQGKSAELFQAVKKKMGKVPNILRTMGHSPAALQAYLGISGAMAESGLSAKLREQLALAIGEKNNCEYCLAAHTMVGKGHGLTDDQALSARQGKSEDPQAQAAIDFALAVMDKNGFVSDQELQAVRDTGFTDAQVIEIVAVITQNIYTNLFNHVADTDVDFPAVQPLGA